MSQPDPKPSMPPAAPVPVVARPPAGWPARLLRAGRAAACSWLLATGAGGLAAQPLAAMEPAPSPQEPAEAALLAGGLAAQALVCPAHPREGLVDLGEVVLRALCSDPRTRQSWAQLAAQLAELMVERSARWPTVGASLAAGHSAQTSRTPGEPPSRQAGAVWDAALELRWVLVDFGQRAAREQAAELAVVAANGSHDDTVQAVTLAAVQAYFALVEAKARLAMLREAERFTRELLVEARRPQRSGEALDKLGQMQARTSLARQVLDLRQAEGDLALARGALAVRMGYPPNAVMDVPLPTLQAPDLQFDSTVESMISLAQEAHPALRAARARLGVARAELLQAERSDRPTIAATASQRRLRDVQALGLGERAVGVQVDIPLFAGQDRQHRVRRAEARVDEARAGLREAGQDAALAVWTAYQGLRAASASVRMAQRYQRSAEDLLSAELEAFRQGDSDMFDVLDAHDSVMSAASAYLSGLTGLSLGRLRLAASLGQLAPGGSASPRQR